jgi:threonine dehydrogenase-like Zn-dependent dehydrogenase
MGIVEEVRSEVTRVQPGDRVVIPFNISCGHCWMCASGFMAQCETTQVRVATVGAMVGTSGPMTVLGVTDPRTWSTKSCLVDIVPHLADGAVTTVVLERLDQD